jgi:biotin transport system substrate-specific component
MSISTPILRTAIVKRSTAMSNALFIFGGAIFLSMLAQISIPVPGSPVPVTGQTFGVLLLATSYGATLALSTFGLYLLAGIAGAPVFANYGHGLDRLVGPTGGYLIGMFLASFVLGKLAGRRWDQKIGSALFAMLIGNIIIFASGLFWLHNYTGKDWAWTFSAGLSPFIIGELLKIAIAGAAMPLLWRAVQR